MIVHLHTIAWNEGRMLDYFFRHYEPWVDRFFIYDDRSIDGTRERLEQHPSVEVADLKKIDPDSWVLSANHIYESSWKRSRKEADWVVVTNIDEHLYHPNMRAYLEWCAREGVTTVPSLGYDMVSPKFPEPGALLSRDLPFGAQFEFLSRIGIFDPKAIEHMEFSPGRHRAIATGRVLLPPRDDVLNLHYKKLGFEYLSRRQRELATGLRRIDLENNWGYHYLWDDDQMADEYQAILARAVNVMESGRDNHVAYSAPRWWQDMPRLDAVVGRGSRP